MRQDDDISIPSAAPPPDLPRPRIQHMDIRPVSRPLNPPPAAGAPGPRTSVPVQPGLAVPGHGRRATDDTVPELPVIDDTPAPTGPKKKKSKLKIVAIVIAVLLLLCGAAAGGGFWWYQQQLLPVTSGDATPVTARVTIKSGSTPTGIATLLKEQGLIRDTNAFLLYVQVTGKQNTMKAGAYELSSAQSLAQIVDHLVEGKEDVFSLTFLPGDTVINHKKRLVAAGYSTAEVDAAFAKTYDSPLFKTKPATADLEGYVYGETYQFDTSATVEDILNKTFGEFQKQVVANDLEVAFKKQGLTLYEGITLASIVQREVSDVADAKQVAQVFFKRLADGMVLGADATFVYAAQKAGVSPSVNLDSPYNTRVTAGLPPGPISSPGLVSLQAVAQPAAGNYVYFVSGDDGKTYFSRTLAEHEALTQTHCKKNCSLF